MIIDSKQLQQHKEWVASGGKKGKRLSFWGVDLRGSFFHGAFLPKALLNRCDIAGVDFSGADLTGAQLFEADCREADFSEADLTESFLSRADLGKTNFSKATLVKAQLFEADCREADFSEADLTESVLSRADLGKTNFSKATLVKAQLFGADCREADFSEADLTESLLNRAYLGKTNFSKATLVKAQLFGADCREADFSAAVLTHVELQNAILDKADFSGADLEGADLTMDASLGFGTLDNTITEKLDNLMRLKLRGYRPFKVVEEERDRFRTLAEELMGQLAAETKRAEEDASNIARNNSSWLSNILPTVDNLEWALDHPPAESDSSSWVDGIRHTYNGVIKLLESNGLRQLRVFGARFDPRLCEAVGTLEGTRAKDDTVIKVMRPGYEYEGEVLRPAMVVVAKNTRSTFHSREVATRLVKKFEIDHKTSPVDRGWISSLANSLGFIQIDTQPATGKSPNEEPLVYDNDIEEWYRHLERSVILNDNEWENEALREEGF